MLRTERDNDVLVWMLDRPEAKNALSADLVGRLLEALATANADASVRAAILTGSGGVFASGGDLRELRDKNTPRDAELLSDRGEELCRRIGELPFPVLAALGGVAIGGGAELAVACDLRIAEEPARLCFKHVRMGATTAWGTAPRLLSLVGPSAAARLLFTACEISAPDAHAMGLVDEVVDSGKSIEASLAWCVDIARGGRAAVAETKRLLREASGPFYAHARVLERAAFIRTWSSAEHTAAIEAYFAQRPRR